MFKKIKPGVLMIVLIVLLAAYFIVTKFSHNDRNFRDKVLEFDPRDITEVTITVPGQPEPTQLVLEEKEWKVLIHGQQYRADTNAVKAMLGQLSDLKTKRFAGKGKEVWQKYELTDSAAVKVEIRAGRKTIANLMVGKFDYAQPTGQQQGMRQQQGDMSTYVRRENEKEAYVVDGMLKLTLGRNGDGFRDKNLTGVKSQDISKVTFTYPDGTMILEKTSGKWSLGGVPADSAKVVHYLNAISRLSSQDFLYDVRVTGAPSHSLTIEGNNFQPIGITAYPLADTNIQWALESSRNADAVFNGKKSKIFGKLMIGKEALLPDPEKK